MALNETLLEAVVVPVISPVDELRIRPGGKARSVDQETGKVPPDACKVTVYGFPTFPFGSTEPVVMINGGTVRLIVKDNVFEFVCRVGAKSVTVNAWLLVPAEPSKGVPLIMPGARAFSANPFGSGGLTDQT